MAATLRDWSPSAQENSFQSDLDASPRNFIKVFEVECFYEEGTQQASKTPLAKNKKGLKQGSGSKPVKRGFLRHRSRQSV